MGVIMEEIQDTGLGLNEFIEGGVQPKEVEPSPETEPSKVEEPKTEEPKKEEVAEKPKEEVSESPKEEKPSEVTDKPKLEWDTDDNPFKKRYFDTQKWGNKAHMENEVLKNQINLLNQQVNILGKKLEGTYNPEVDDIKPPDPSVIADSADAAGRIKASMAMAKSQFGEEYVNKMIFDPDAPFRQIQDNPVIKLRVTSSDTPILEALKIVKEKEFFDKWGYDPETIQKRMWESAKAELKEEVWKELKSKITLKEEQPQGIGSARNANVGSVTKPDGFMSLTEIFGR